MLHLRLLSVLPLLILLNACGGQHRPSYQPRYDHEVYNDAPRYQEGCDAYDREGRCLAGHYHGKPLPRPVYPSRPAPDYRGACERYDNRGRCEADSYHGKSLPQSREAERRAYEKQAENIRRAQEQKKQAQDHAQQRRYDEQQRLKQQQNRRIAPPPPAAPLQHENVEERKKREYEAQKREQYCKRNVCR